MVLTALVWLGSPALAQTYITDIGPPVEQLINGGWPRTLWYDDPTGDCPPFEHLNEDCTGWKLLWAAGGEYRMIDLPENLEGEDRNRVSIAPSTELKDHAFTRCASGGYLHTASANIIEANDSAYAFRYDKDLNLMASGTIEEGVTERHHNDMPLACAPLGWVTIFGGSEPDIVVHSRYFWLNQEADTIRTKDLDNMPRTAGCSIRWEPETESLLVIEMERNNTLQVSRLDRDMNLQEIRTLDILPEGHGVWDGLVGQIWLGVFDRDWNLLEFQQATDLNPPSGAMTPGLSRHGNKVLLSYDLAVTPTLQELTLDLDALGLVDGDTGGHWDTGAYGDDTGETEEPEDTEVDSQLPEDSGEEQEIIDGVAPKEVCGCVQAAGAGGSLGILGLVAFVGRRRRGGRTGVSQ